MLEKYDIILASNSPRRKELLGGLGVNFRVQTISGLDESYPETLQAGEIPLYLAKKKSSAYEQIMAANTMIITADTIVWHNNRVLGKPKSREQAIEMIRSLAGDNHKVFTGVCVKTKDREASFFCESSVKFAALTQAEIEYYVDNYKPFDKAGAYGIQEWIGYVGVESMVGSFYNIMGLPVHQLYAVLKSFE
ncbi:MAG: Maf-like protein [Paludibacteraceae bacterium]|nr:Maf-like protein [Paludibacteraceae bacterium]